MAMKSITASTMFFLSTQSLYSQTLTPIKTDPGEIPWSLSYTSYFTSPNFTGSSEGLINQYLTLKRKISQGWSISGTLRADSGLEVSSNEPPKTGDHYISLHSPNFYRGDYGAVSALFRVYTPASESAKEAKIRHLINPRISYSHSVGDFDFAATLRPVSYIYKNNTDNQTMVAATNYFGAAYNLTDTVSIDLDALPSWSFKRSKRQVFNNCPTYLGVSNSFSDTLTMAGYVEVLSTQLRKETSNLGAMVSYKLF